MRLRELFVVGASVLVLGGSVLPAWSQAATIPAKAARCGGAFTMRVPDPPAQMNAAGPLDIVVSFDAVAIGSKGPFNITTSDRNLRMSINGAGAFTVTLTTGAAQTAEDIVDDLWNNGTFASQAFATTYDNRVIVRSRYGSSGTITFIDAGYSAINELGFVASYLYTQTMTSAEQGLVLQAVAEWEARVKHVSSIPNPYPIGLAIYPLGGALGITNTSRTGAGIPQSAVITLDGAEDWYVDTTPWNNDEWVAFNEYTSTCNDPACRLKYDMLSVVRHEMGHAIGWLGVSGTGLSGHLTSAPLTSAMNATQTSLTVSNATTFTQAGVVLINSEQMSYTGKSANTLTGLIRGSNGTTAAAHVFASTVVSGNTFDIGRLNIGVIQFGSHADETIHPNDLMNPTIGSETRRAISHYPNLARLARDQNYNVVMTFLDGSNGGSENGTADFPWNTFDEAVWCPDGNLLIVPGTYVDPATSMTITVPCIYRAARGGSAVITSN